MLYGRGAGMLPTASAVVSDVIYAAKQEQHAYMTFANEDDAPQWLIHQKDWLSGFYIRMTVCHKAGTLAEITRVLGEENVSVSSVMQNDVMDANGNVQLVFITDESRELAVQSALARLAALPCVDHIDSVMRVEK